MEGVYLSHGLNEVLVGTIEQVQILAGSERHKAMNMEERKIIAQSLIQMVAGVMECVLDSYDTTSTITLEIR